MDSDPVEDPLHSLDPENLVAEQMMGAASPLPPAEVLVPILEGDGVPPLAGGTTAPRYGGTEGIPDWVRELALLEGEYGPSALKPGPDEPLPGARAEE